jgi:hypothetical protein
LIVDYKLINVLFVERFIKIDSNGKIIKMSDLEQCIKSIENYWGKDAPYHYPNLFIEICLTHRNHKIPKKFFRCMDICHLNDNECYERCKYKL